MIRKNVALEDETMAKLEKQAAEEQRTISNLLRKIVVEYYAEDKGGVDHHE